VTVAAASSGSIAYHGVIWVTASNNLTVTVTPYIDLLAQVPYIVKVSGHSVAGTCEVAVPVSGVLSVTTGEIIYLRVELSSYAYSAIADVKFVYNSF
jgi:hypothetical protein